MTDEKEVEEEKTKLIMFPDLFAESTVRTSGIYGEINEERSKATIASLFQLKTITPTNNEEEEKDPEPPLPIDFIISTEGGNVQDMFAVYDCMRDIQKDCELHTFGLGKVMSAGILLLAAGTKGKRRVGKYCRLMMHSIQGGQFGSIKELEIDMREVRWYQEQFIKAIGDESKLDKKELKKIFASQTDTYFDAKQAVEWGLADEII